MVEKAYTRRKLDRTIVKVLTNQHRHLRPRREVIVARRIVESADISCLAARVRFDLLETEGAVRESVRRQVARSVGASDKPVVSVRVVK